MGTMALILFILTYILLLFFPKYRAYISLISASVYIMMGIISIKEVFFMVNWDIILMIIGTMGMVSLFIESGMPALFADLIIMKTSSIKWAIIFLALLAGLISAFVDNVATVLMIAPVAINISKKLRISPVSSTIAIAVSSNLQGAATLVGDTTSILLSGFGNLDFLDFFFFKGRLGMFWVTQAGAFGSAFVLMYIFRKYNKSIKCLKRTVVKDLFPTALLVGMISILITVSFIPNKPRIINGIICMSLFYIGLARNYFKSRNINVIRKAVKEIDYFTILLLIGLFIVVGAIMKVGVVNEISKLFVKVSRNNIFLIYSLIVWVSVICSAFIDNIPYVATMLPVAAEIANIFNMEPYLLFFGLLSGATLGGNLTPIGASANITALGILKKEGYEVSTKEFMKIGVPFTLVAITIGYVLIWILWK